MKKIAFLLILLTTGKIFAQSTDEAAVRKVLATQNAAWNRGDIDAFMVGYWHSDSLMFIGQSGVTYGWQNTLNNYKKNYSDTAKMGKLNFTLITVKQLSGKYYRVVGKWYLTRTVGDVGGHFTLLFEKINGEWVIIEDHTS
jgi:ketosteroid isomerase-like protein